MQNSFTRESCSLTRIIVIFIQEKYALELVDTAFGGRQPLEGCTEVALHPSSTGRKNLEREQLHVQHSRLSQRDTVPSPLQLGSLHCLTTVMPETPGIAVED